ncbi:MAG: hypothetical protein K0R55_2583 [Sporomusa sp.]|nr:hypothetical protein [Sporomusa sp.]
MEENRDVIGTVPVTHNICLNMRKKQKKGQDWCKGMPILAFFVT